MRDFFRPWRRKIGVCTLVVACGFMGMWARSTVKTEFVGYPLAHFYYVGLSSADQAIACRLSYDNTNPHYDCEWKLYDLQNWPSYLDRTFRIRHPLFPGTRTMTNWIYRWDRFGVGKEVEKYSDDPTTRYAITVLAPYWSVVLPLTALSAVLLLKKPKTPTPKKILEPTRNEGVES